MRKEELLKQIAEELEAVDVFSEYCSNVAILNSNKIRLGVLGQANSGKTSLLNALLGTNLPTSNLPSGINYTVSYSKDDSEKKDVTNQPNMVLLNNEWLDKNNIDVLEINMDVNPDEITQVDLCKILSNCDVCIYMLSAQAALNRTDLFILKNLSEINIQSLVVLSRTDLLSNEDCTQVIEYINNNLKKYSNIQVFEDKHGILTDTISEEIQKSVENLLHSVNISISRECFSNFYLGYALSLLFAKCQERIDECVQKQKDLEKLAEEKKNKLNEKTTDWLKVETELRQKTSDISNKLRVFLDNRKDDMIRRLTHDVDVCGDVKLFWEKDFPFRLEEMMKIEMQSATQMINQELIKTMQWLQDELLKKFRSRISLTTGIVNDNMRDSVLTSSGVEIADTNKLKIVTRIGTAATVIAAGALFATSGVGGIIMAVSMVSGLGAEFFMKKQINESKEQIKRCLPEIVMRSHLQMVTDFNTKIDEMTNKLVSHLQVLKSEWIESSIKAIDQEKAIAIFNFNPTKWDNLMSRINQLSEIILK